jgi:hypothetical protein
MHCYLSLAPHADGTITVIPYFNFGMFTAEEQGLMTFRKWIHMYIYVL